MAAIARDNFGLAFITYHPFFVKFNITDGAPVAWHANNIEPVGSSDWPQARSFEIPVVCVHFLRYESATTNEVTLIHEVTHRFYNKAMHVRKYYGEKVAK